MTDSDGITPEDDLLESIETGVRIFGLSDPQSTQALGVVLEETEDSFLVALPSVFIVEEGKSPSMRLLFRAVPFIRLLKSGVSLVSLVDERIEKVYLDFVQEEVYSVFPEYVPGLLSDLGRDTVKKMSSLGSESDLEKKLTEVLESGDLHDAKETLQ